VKQIGDVFAFLHNAWLTQPPALRTGERRLGIAVLAVVLAFAWTLPNPLTLEAIVAQVQAVWLLLIPVAIPIIRDDIVPALVAWFLSTFGYAPAYKVQPPERHFGGLKHGDFWVRT